MAEIPNLPTLKRVQAVAHSLRFAGINARASSKDNSIRVRDKMEYDLIKKNQMIIFNKIKVKLANIK